MPSKEQWSNSLVVLAALMCMFMGFLLGRVFQGGAETGVERAICVFNDEIVSGFVTMATRPDGRVFLYGKLSGIDGEHGVHIHDYGNLGDGCRATGNHFNPTSASHGYPEAVEKHAGDLGNVNFRNRSAVLRIETTAFSLTGVNAVVGRSLVVHQRKDDMGLGGHPASSVNGAAGEKLACCIIAIDRHHSES